MKRIAAWLVAFLVMLAIAVGTGVWYRYSEQRKQQLEAEVQLRRTAARDRLSAFAKATGANMEWERKIPTVRYTADFERLWLTGDPMVFVGNVADVSSADPQHYLLRLEYRAPFFLLLKRFRLHVVCQKEKVDHVLGEVGGPQRRPTSAGVAVAARVERVQSQGDRSELGSEFDNNVVFTGVGTCIVDAFCTNGSSPLRFDPHGSSIFCSMAGVVSTCCGPSAEPTGA